MDTAPSPVPVYRAQKSQPLIPAVKTNSWNLSLRQHSDDLCNCTTGTSTARSSATGRIARNGRKCWTMGKPQRDDGEVNVLEEELQLRILQTESIVWTTAPVNHTITLFKNCTCEYASTAEILGPADNEGNTPTQREVRQNQQI